MSKREVVGIEPLFEVSLPEKRQRTPTQQQNVRWTKYGAATPTPCDDCRDGQIDGTKRVAANQARRVRTAPNGTKRWLCHWHANEWREADGLKAFQKF